MFRDDSPFQKLHSGVASRQTITALYTVKNGVLSALYSKDKKKKAVKYERRHYPQGERQMEKEIIEDKYLQNYLQI